MSREPKENKLAKLVFSGELQASVFTFLLCQFVISNWACRFLQNYYRKFICKCLRPIEYGLVFIDLDYLHWHIVQAGFFSMLGAK